MHKVKSLITWQLILSALGWFLALYTLWHRNSLLLQGLTQKSFCNVSSFLNCDAVAASSYSAIGGYPIAALGMIHYSVIFVFLAWFYFQVKQPATATFSRLSFSLFIFNGTMIVPSLTLALTSVFFIKSLCLMCLGTYIVNIVLLILSYKVFKISMASTAASALLPALKTIPSGLFALLLLVIGLNAMAPSAINSTIGANRSLSEGMINTYVNYHKSNQQFTFAEDTPVLGPVDAPITIVEFSDYACPFCAQASATLPAIVHSFSGRVRLLFKSFPLSNECNPAMEASGHPSTCLAAKAGWCVFKESGSSAFYQYKSAVFERQKQLSERVIKTQALRFVDQNVLDACIVSAETHDAIVNQTQEARRAGLEGTPTIYVNGRKVEGGISPIILRAVIQSYL